MNSKFVTTILAGVTILSLAFGVFSYSKASRLERETEQWKAKYEEAIVDAEEAGERIEKMKEELEAALQEATRQRDIAVKALEEAQKKKAGR
jgi:multidrug resistance efflux pump